ncbi:chymotrypsin inhibitor-like protein [Lasius niger]|uniref:Chymotrypsin inhibitor-like protein n=1 Tax=Lasius niger TaxID=67767 RepID=A0A0J7LAV8_LASNI|nr:chymotrypsin inhibitor-like protein [Lasius niger]
MSRNLMVLFLLMAIVCTVMSWSPPPPEDCKPPPPPPPPPKQCKPLPPPPPPPKCPKNEIYKKCGTACQPSCKNPNPICNKLCVKGCFCKDGQLRNKWGKCVEPCDC